MLTKLLWTPGLTPSRFTPEATRNSLPTALFNELPMDPATEAVDLSAVGVADAEATGMSTLPADAAPGSVIVGDREGVDACARDTMLATGVGDSAAGAATGFGPKGVEAIAVLPAALESPKVSASLPPIQLPTLPAPNAVAAL